MRKAQSDEIASDVRSMALRRSANLLVLMRKIEQELSKGD